MGDNSPPNEDDCNGDLPPTIVTTSEAFYNVETVVWTMKITREGLKVTAASPVPSRNENQKTITITLCTGIRIYQDFAFHEGLISV